MSRVLAALEDLCCTHVQRQTHIWLKGKQETLKSNKEKIIFLQNKWMLVYGLFLILPN